MKAEVVSILLGFIEGFSLIISPCILPVLPVFLASSMTGSKQRPIGIIVGFTLFFAVVAYFSHEFFQYTHLDPNTLRNVSFVILILLGVIMMSTYLTELFSRLTQGLTQVSGLYSNKSQAGGFLNGLFLGALIAIIWTPCAGPILAAVIVQIATQQSSITSFWVLIAFSFGAAMPMFIIAFYGKKIMTTFGFFKKRAVIFRKLLGAVIIASVVYMVYFDGALITPSQAAPELKATSLKNGLVITYQAPAIDGIDAWINSPSLNIEQLKGKVVLIDFWAYSCINCIRTLPYIKDWYKKYQDQGLVIIGIHTPEFEFEKNPANVEKAVKSDGILYPVALDSHYKTWTNYSNHYWPAHYLIDKNGKVVYTHFGEGDYDVTENNIRFLLGIKDAMPTNGANEQKTSSYTITPETYLGYGRAASGLSPKLSRDNRSTYQFPQQLTLNAWGLQGDWEVNEDKIIAKKANSALKIHFKAGKVFMVMGTSNGKPIKVQLLLNGEQLLNGQGKDVKDGSLIVDTHTLYEVVSQKNVDTGYLQIIAYEPGLEIYTFTFGQ